MMWTWESSGGCIYTKYYKQQSNVGRNSPPLGRPHHTGYPIAIGNPRKLIHTSNIIQIVKVVFNVLNIYIWMHVCLYTCMYIYLSIYACICLCIYTYMYITTVKEQRSYEFEREQVGLGHGRFRERSRSTRNSKMM